MVVLDFLSDEWISVTAVDDVSDTLLNDVTRVILFSCDVVLAAAAVLFSVLVSEVAVVVLALEEIISVCVVACLDAEDDANPFSQFSPVNPGRQLQE